MEPVTEWLNANDLSELVDVFKSHKINSLRRVRGLTQDMITVLVPEFGPQAEFLECQAKLRAEANEHEISGSHSIINKDLINSASSSQSIPQNIIVDGKLDNTGTILFEYKEVNDDEGNGNSDSGILVSDWQEFNLQSTSKSPVIDIGAPGNSNLNPQSGASHSDNLKVVSSDSPPRKRKYTSRSQETTLSKHCFHWKSLNHLKSLDLKELLEGDLTSKVALTNYKRDGVLLKHDRSAIVMVVVREMLQFNHYPKQEEYQVVTDKICKLFPHEAPEICYCPPKEIHKNATGKLPNKVRNFKYTLEKKGCAQLPAVAPTLNEEIAPQTFCIAAVKPAQLTGCTDKHNPALISAISVLKHGGTDSWPNLLEKWSITHPLRYKCLRETRPQHSPPNSQRNVLETEIEDENSCLLVNEYFSEWSILKAPNGHLLICQDFAELFPGRENGLLFKWDESKQFIVDLARLELSKSDQATLALLNCIEEAHESKRDVLILHLLPVVCRERSSVGKGARKGKSKLTTKEPPSTVESRMFFFIHVKIPGDLNREVRNRHQFLLSCGLRAQPFLVFVGPSLTEITASYVQIDSVRYQLRTPIAAVDACFKAFFAIDAAYPEECKSVWLFIQRYFYGLVLEEDGNVGRVSAVISSLNSLRDKQQ